MISGSSFRKTSLALLLVLLLTRFSGAGVEGGGVTLYKHKDFAGAHETFYGDDATLKDNPFGNDEASSVRVAPGCRVVLYRDIYFEGRSTELTSDVANLRATRVDNDEVSSLRVRCDSAQGAVPTTKSPAGSPTVPPAVDARRPLQATGNGPQLRLRPSLTSGVTTVAFAPRRGILVSGQEDGTVRIWDVKDGVELRRITSHQGRVIAVAFSPDGKWLASRASLPPDRRGLFPKARSEIRIWDAATGEQVRRLETENDSPLTFSPDGRYLAACAKAPTLWPVDAGSSPPRVLGSGFCSHLAFSADGRRLLTVGLSKGIQVWNVASGQLDRVLEAKGPVFHPLVPHPDGRRLTGRSSRLGGTSRIAELRTWDLGSGAVVSKIDLRAPARSLAFSPDGRYLAAVTGRGPYFGIAGVEYPTLHLWDATSGERVHGFADVTDFFHGVAFSPDGGFLAGASAEGLALWEVESGRRRLDFFTEEIAATEIVRFTADGRSLVSVGPDGWVGAWDLRTAERAAERAVDRATVVASTPGGRRIVFVTEERRISDPDLQVELSTVVHVRSAADADVQKSFAIYPGPVVALDLSPDGSSLAVASRYSPTDLSVPPSERSRYTNSPPGNPLTIWYSANGRQGKTFFGGESKSDADWTIEEALGTHRLRVLRWAPSGGRLVTAGGAEGGGELLVWSSFGTLQALRWSDTRRVSDVHPSPIVALAFSDDGRRLFSGTADGTVQRWGLDEATWGPRGPRIEMTLAGTGAAVTALVAADDRTLVGGYANGAIRVWDVERGTARAVGTGTGRAIRSLALSADGRGLASVSDDHLVRLWDFATGEEKVALIALAGDDTVAVTPDLHYLATRDSRGLISFSVGEQTFPFEQFDLQLNRPDQVLRRLPGADPRWIRAYARAWERRLEKAGLAAETLSGERHLPTLRILDADRLPASTSEPRLRLRLEAAGERFALDSLHLWVNGVPVFGRRGRELEGRQARLEVDVELSSGENRIDAAVRNRQGVESLRARHRVFLERPSDAEQLYVFAVGVSSYADSSQNLGYAAKDAEDVVALFERSRRHAEVHTRLLLDAEATRENILAGRDFLAQAGVDDQVVVFVAGHGLLDDRDDYYYAPHEMDFADPRRHGVAYEELEGLADAIPSRKKLVLIDTCFSGEVENVATTDFGAGRSRGGRRGVELLPQEPDEDDTPLDLETLFLDLERGIGATVISAASGRQYAWEEDVFSNGYFTFSVRKGIMTREADLDGDGRIMASELYSYVTADVREASSGGQRPTRRRENLAYDFRVW